LTTADNVPNPGELAELMNVQLHAAIPEPGQFSIRLIFGGEQNRHHA
jgi:hypothetical protein